MRVLIFLSAFVFNYSTVAAGADVMVWIKGCLVMAGVGMGGTSLAVSQSGADLKDTQALVVAGATSCLIGGFLAEDVVTRAVMKSEGELQLRNARLKHGVYSVMHDLCVLKNTCGPDGLPMKTDLDNKTYDMNSEFVPLKSGN